jgi:hypothetical protein
VSRDCLGQIGTASPAKVGSGRIETASPTKVGLKQTVIVSPIEVGLRRTVIVSSAEVGLGRVMTTSGGWPQATRAIGLGRVVASVCEAVEGFNGRLNGWRSRLMKTIEDFSLFDAPDDIRKLGLLYKERGNGLGLIWSYKRNPLGAHLVYTNRRAANKYIHQVIIFFLSFSCVSL